MSAASALGMPTSSIQDVLAACLEREMLALARRPYNHGMQMIILNKAELEYHISMSFTATNSISDTL